MAASAMNARPPAAAPRRSVDAAWSGDDRRTHRRAAASRLGQTCEAWAIDDHAGNGEGWGQRQIEVGP